MAKGGCNCGAIKFEITCDISDVYVCHCSICRRSTGSGGIAVVVVNNSQFKWIQGQDQINTWVKPCHDWQTSFCKTCGSALPGKNDQKHTYIPAGTLTEGDENLKVAKHLFTESKACWEEIIES